MIDKAYEELIKMKEKIMRDSHAIHKELSESVESILNELWINYSPESVEHSKKLLAIDGGMWVKETRQGVIFIVNAKAIVFEGINEINSEGKVLVHIFSPGNYAKERIELLMQLLELQLALKLVENVDYVLLDGSFSKKLGRHKSELKLDLLDDIVSIDKILSLEEKDEDNMLRFLIAENQLVLSELVSRYKDKLLFISKNSKSSDLFKQAYSDITILELFTQDCGYSKILEKKIDENYILSRKASKLLSGLNYYFTNVRLEPSERLFRLDFFSADRIFEYLKVLKPVSLKGYPYPLIKVHKDVRVGKEDRERIYSILEMKRKDISWWPSQFY
ncbi:hypothetical protein SUSAZ_00235 [Sulfolobus acidocaldarius SUSAZ]|nr:hypothetical protein SUSAZ_00235 [Sulfolobus acidocaldarius SUSAZ]